MNEYEGLQLSQLLDLLNGLVQPAAITMRPQTVGWKIVGAWLLVCIGLTVWQMVRQWRHNRYRREALSLLGELESNSNSTDGPSAGLIAQLVKRTALVAYPRAKVASLSGDQWATFLRETADNDPLVVEKAQDLATAAYREKQDGMALVEPARRWIERHRA